jgi:hypothetical protein
MPRQNLMDANREGAAWAPAGASEVAHAQRQNLPQAEGIEADMTGSAATSAKERLEGSGREANDLADPTSADEELVNEPRKEAACILAMTATRNWWLGR